jgi:hypothetical protein
MVGFFPKCGMRLGRGGPTFCECLRPRAFFTHYNAHARGPNVIVDPSIIRSLGVE